MTRPRPAMHEARLPLRDIGAMPKTWFGKAHSHVLTRCLLILIPSALTATSGMAAMAGPDGGGGRDSGKSGYWWYVAPPVPEEEAELQKPEIPSMVELARLTPPQIRKLIEAQRDYAATVLSVEAVADFWRLQDFARRKARAFAGVTQIAMLQHPELNSRSANPMVGDARALQTGEKDAARRAYLRAQAGEFALILFSRVSCGYCRVQRPIVARFREEMGWQVSEVDLDQRPEAGLRLGVEATPSVMLIRRNSSQHMLIATGVEAYPALTQTAYQAVRLLKGDIRPEQFLTGPGQADGFFDALANGPVSAGTAGANPTDEMNGHAITGVP